MFLIAQYVPGTVPVTGENRTQERLIPCLFRGWSLLGKADRKKWFVKSVMREEVQVPSLDL